MSEYKDLQYVGGVEQVTPAKKSSHELERELTSEELQKRLRDPNFLPTSIQIKQAFISQRDWIRFCFDEINPVYEFLNNEYLEALSDYFVDRIREHSANEKRPLVILEIGAGNGRLSHFLQQKLEEKAPRQTKVVATDSGEWALKSDYPVEQLKHDEAMKKYSPDIVVFSWMPYGEDCSKDFRKCPSVKEYILIGETDAGVCGDGWETWGCNCLTFKDGKMNFEEKEQRKNQPPPYKVDGFTRVDLINLSDLQICRSDWDYHYSKTVSFRREPI